MGKSRRARALSGRCKKAASGPSFLSTPIDAFRKIPRLFKAVNSFNSGRWWAHQESNLELILRRDWLYPFNYRSGDGLRSRLYQKPYGPAASSPLAAASP